MKNLALALVAFAFTAPAMTAAQDIAPAVKRKPAAASTAPAAPRRSLAQPASPAASKPGVATSAGPAPAEPVAATSTAPATPQRPARMASERDVQAALATVAAQGGGDSALDTSLIRVMSRLVVAGRCSEAASLAAQDGRTALATRAAQLCR